MVRKGFGNEPLKDITMERVGVEEFKESLCVDCIVCRQEQPNWSVWIEREKMRVE